MSDTATEIRSYTLVEFDAESSLEDCIYTETGDVLVLRSYEDAIAAAKVEVAKSDPKRRPFIGILEHDHADPGENYDTRTDDPQSWAMGWVTADGTYVEGDYENDPGLWAR